MTMPDILLFVTPETLSDKSVVWNVTFGNEKLAATSREAAGALAEDIASLVDEHTAQTAGVIYE